ncbi:MAG: ABC transporter permease [Acidobacteriota bacterium]
MRSVLQDLRYSFRQLIKTPGFTLTALLSLALGIGATTAVFSVVYGILMDPYPYRAPDRMAHLRLLTPKGDLGEFVPVTASQWQVLRKSPVVEDAFISMAWDQTVTANGIPEDVRASYLSSNGFEFLGVPAALGRGLQPSDAIDGQDPQPVVVLGYKFWQRHFHSDPGVVGRTLQLDHKNYMIVGVAAQRFTWDDGDMYLAQKITGDQVLPYFAEIRLKPGITHAQADAALQPLVNEFARETPKHFPPDQKRLQVVGINEQFIRSIGGTLYLLLGAVALLLAIGCGNVSILLLARATGREHEFAVRSAIGASRSRIIRQLLTESTLIAVTGAALGVGLAYKSLDLIVANLPINSFPHEAAIRVNLPVLLFSILVAVGTGILFGLWPALQLSKPEVSQMMQSTTRKTTRGVSGRKLHNALIAGQIALTLLLLAGAGAAIDGFLRVARAPLGYDPHNVLAVGLPNHQGAYDSWAARTAYFERLRQSVAQTPGVEEAALSMNATPPENGFNTQFEILGSPSGEDQKARLNVAGYNYFSVLRVPLARGRIWSEDEERRVAMVAVVNRTFVRKYFPSGDAIGRSIRFGQLPAQPPYSYLAPGGDGWLQIVGVIEDKRNDGLSAPIQPEVFVPDTLVATMWNQVLVRTAVAPATLLHAIQLKVAAVDHNQQISAHSEDLEQMIHDEPDWARGHLISWLFAAFAGLALLMAAVGLYSVVSYTVAQRTNEFGIRMALGARRGHVLAIVFQSTLASVLSGVAAGMVLTVALSKVMTHWDAQSASSRDPLLLASATVVLALVAAIACLLPAIRAAAIEPMSAIRYE